METTTAAGLVDVGWAGTTLPHVTLLVVEGCGELVYYETHVIAGEVPLRYLCVQIVEVPGGQEERRERREREEQRGGKGG